jgi:hypothetical protein
MARKFRAIQSTQTKNLNINHLFPFVLTITLRFLSTKQSFKPKISTYQIIYTSQILYSPYAGQAPSFVQT